MRCKNGDFQIQHSENGVVDPRKRVQIKHNEKSVKIKKTIVLGQAGKVTGRNKDVYNVEKKRKRGKKKVLTSANFPGKKADSQEEVNVAVTADDPMKVAKTEELRNFKDFDTYEEVAEEGHLPTVSTRWVITDLSQEDWGKNLIQRDCL